MTLLCVSSEYPTVLVVLLVFFFFQAEDGIRALIVTGVQTCALPISDSALMQVLERLNRAADNHLQRPEFASLSAPPATLEDGEVSWLRSWFGPSRQERRLSVQRIAALERAERAERSAFEALAETARVARERDEAVVRIRELEQLSSGGAEEA